MKKFTTAAALFLVSMPAFAEEVAGQMQASGGGISDKAFLALAMALVVGIGALGGTLAQGKVGAAAMEGIARNPQAAKAMQTPMILGLALIESLVIVSAVIAFLINNK